MTEGVSVFIAACVWLVGTVVMMREISDNRAVLEQKHVAWTLECAKSCEDAGLQIEAVSFGSNPSCSCR